jgi:hypothetical protein
MSSDKAADTKESTSTTKPKRKPIRPSEADIPKEFAERSEAETRQFFRDLAQRIRYADYEYLSIEAFRRLVNLAVLDTWSEVKDEEIAKRLHVELEVLETYRDNPEYVRIQADLRQAFQWLAAPKTLKDHLEDPLTQDGLAKRTVRIAKHARDPKDSIKALEAAHDRTTPIVKREEQVKVLYIRGADIEMWQQVESEIAGYDQTVIEGEVMDDSEREGEAAEVAGEDAQTSVHGPAPDAPDAV